MFKYFNQVHLIFHKHYVFQKKLYLTISFAKLNNHSFFQMTNEEGYEIMFKQEKLFEIEVSNLKKSTLITHRSNTNESFIRMEFNDGTIQTRRTSNINNIINQGGDVRTSSIKSPTENIVIYNQPTSETINISINGENRQIIGIVQNIPRIISS